MPYLYFLKRARHHGYEHVDEHYDGHYMVDHEKDLPDPLRERLHRTLSHCAQWHQAKQRPEQRQIAVPYATMNRATWH